MEELVCFRLKVRQFALASGEAPGEARRQRLLERQPLLEACDALRRDLAVIISLLFEEHSSVILLGRSAGDKFF